MADGEVEVQVRAEGTDEAAEQLAEGAEADGDGGVAAGRGEGGLRSALRGGIIGGLIAQSLGPLLEVLDPILQVLQAFLAPLSVMLLRLLMPVLRLLIQFLPTWMAMMDVIASNMEYLALLFGVIGVVALAIDKLPGLIQTHLSSEFGRVTDRLRSLPRQIWSFVRRLPNMIGQAIGQRLPNVPGASASDTASDVVESGKTAVGDARDTVINFSGGLAAFVEQAERNGSIDFP